MPRLFLLNELINKLMSLAHLIKGNRGTTHSRDLLKAENKIILIDLQGSSVLINNTQERKQNSTANLWSVALA